MQHLNKRLSPQSLQNHSGAGETPRGEVLRFEISRGRSDCAGAVFVLFFDLAVTSVLHVLASIVAPSCGCRVWPAPLALVSPCRRLLRSVGSVECEDENAPLGCAAKPISARDEKQKMNGKAPWASHCSAVSPHFFTSSLFTCHLWLLIRHILD